MGGFRIPASGLVSGADEKLRAWAFLDRFESQQTWGPVKFEFWLIVVCLSLGGPRGYVDIWLLHDLGDGRDCAQTDAEAPRRCSSKFTGTMALFRLMNAENSAY